MADQDHNYKIFKTGSNNHPTQATSNWVQTLLERLINLKMQRADQIYLNPLSASLNHGAQLNAQVAKIRKRSFRCPCGSHRPPA